MANNQLLASDNFASGSLAAGWAAYPTLSECKIVGSGTSAVAEPNALSTAAGQLWTALTWPNDQTCEVTLGSGYANEASTFIVLCLRNSASADSGYHLNIGSSHAIVYKLVAGTATALSTTAATPAANDIWTFQVAGPYISVYQNFNRVAYFEDTTYTTGGYVGFQCYSSSNIVHAQVSSWRGYNMIQQDGIWQKQGITIAATSTDLAANGFGVFDNSVILYEGNAQILSGKVYKTWGSSFATGGASGITYYESTDGINWSRYASLVLSGYATPCIIKVGNIYYMYCQPTASWGTGDFALYTSTDGINWAQQSTTILGIGGSSDWDYPHLWTFNPVAIIAGTWYALYYAGPNSATTQGSMGLATSSDGLNWNKYSHTTPVIPNFYGGQAIVKVGGIWYYWGGMSSPGRGADNADDPADNVRYQSTDLKNWTKSAQSVHCSQIYEGVNTVRGQAYFNSIINIGGKAYAYSTSSPSDPTAPQLFQIGLSIAPVPIESVVTQPEDAAQQIATDAFTSGLGDLSANWTVPTGGTKLKIVSGPYVEPTATSTNCQAIYTGAAFNPNQYSEVTIQTLSGTLNSSFIDLLVLASTTSLTDYEASISSPTATSDAAARIYKRVNNSATEIGPIATCEPQVGDVWRLSVFTGSDGFPVLSLFQNGFLILQVQDQSTTPLTSGYPGIVAYSSIAIGDAQISSWAGGNANVIPNYPSTGGSSSSWLTVANQNFLRGLKH